jgi:signal transduction histidine kinase
MPSYPESSAELKNVLRSIVELAKDLMQADIATLYIYDAATDTYNMATDLGATKPLDRTPRESGVTTTIVKGRKLVYSNNASEDSLFLQSPFTKNEGIDSVLGIPLEREDAVIGVMYFNYRTRNQITEERLRIVMPFVRVAAIAIESTRIAQTLGVLHEVGQSILSTQEFSNALELAHGQISGMSGVTVQILNKIVRTALEVLKTDIVTLYMYDKKISQFELPPVMAGDLREASIPRRTKIYPDDAARIVLDEKLDYYYARDSQNDPIMCGELKFDHEGRPRQRFVQREGIVSSGILRLKAGDETVGVMFVNFRTRQEFLTEQKAVIGVFANQAALAVQNMRLYSHILDALLAEQKMRLDAEEKVMTAKLDDVAGTFFHRVVNEIGTIPFAAKRLRKAISAVPNKQDILWYLDQIEKDVERFVTLAEKVSFPFTHMDPRPLDITRFVPETISQITKPDNVRVIEEVEPTQSVVNIDSSMFAAILRNLTDNAIGAMPDGGTLTIRTRRISQEKMQFAEIEVQDTGTGIPAEVLTDLFRPFTKGKTKGMGIGLWQCKTFLERVGGAIQVRSELGKGSIFTIRLPIVS